MYHLALRLALKWVLLLVVRTLQCLLVERTLHCLLLQCLLVERTLHCLLLQCLRVERTFLNLRRWTTVLLLLITSLRLANLLLTLLERLIERRENLLDFLPALFFLKALRRLRLNFQADLLFFLALRAALREALRLLRRAILAALRLLRRAILAALLALLAALRLLRLAIRAALLVAFLLRLKARLLLRLLLLTDLDDLLLSNLPLLPPLDLPLETLTDLVTVL